MSIPAPASPHSGEDSDPLLTPGEVAAIFRVDPKTVTRWAASVPPKIRSTRTPGGHRRFRRSEVDRLLKGQPPQGGQPLSGKPVNMLCLGRRGCYGLDIAPGSRPGRQLQAVPTQREPCTSKPAATRPWTGDRRMPRAPQS